MKYQLINPINLNYSAIEQILTNRGVRYEDIFHYINTTDNDINSFTLLREDKIRTGAKKLLFTIASNQDAFMPVD